MASGAVLGLVLAVCFGRHQASDYTETRSSQLGHIAAYVNGGS